MKDYNELNVNREFYVIDELNVKIQSLLFQKQQY